MTTPRLISGLSPLLFLLVFIFLVTFLLILWQTQCQILVSFIALVSVRTLEKRESIKQGLWKQPTALCIKCKTDGATRGFPGMAGSSGIFINVGVSNGFFFFCWVWLLFWLLKQQFLTIGGTSGWKLTLTLLLLAFSHPKSVHWSINTSWTNCINHTNHINFRIYHIYREGNACTDKLAFFGV